MANEKKVAVLGAGMHPWGKWGRNFVEYGLAAAGDALAEAGVAWTDIQYVSGADTIRCSTGLTGGRWAPNASSAARLISAPTMEVRDRRSPERRRSRYATSSLSRLSVTWCFPMTI